MYDMDMKQFLRQNILDYVNIRHTNLLTLVGSRNILVSNIAELLWA